MTEASYRQLAECNRRRAAAESAQFHGCYDNVPPAPGQAKTQPPSSTAKELAQAIKADVQRTLLATAEVYDELALERDAAGYPGWANEARKTAFRARELGGIDEIRQKLVPVVDELGRQWAEDSLKPENRELVRKAFAPVDPFEVTDMIALKELFDAMKGGKL